MDRISESLKERGYAHVVPPSDRDVDYAAEVGRLGPLLPQYAGELVRDIKPSSEFDDEQFTPYNTKELRPHTEWYEFPELPPRYVAIWAVHAAEGPGGETTLADGYELVASFSPAEQEALAVNAYEWRTDPGRTPERVDRRAERPVLQHHPDGLVLRFSTMDLQVRDELSQRYVAEGVRFFDQHHVAVKVETNALLIWDNWRMLHSRTAFRDHQRHLRRALVGLSVS
ncbi:TauD/TfdA family dioxygenase [Saccharothrix sp. 6-C]|uniref:TauD/TfdA family dioxygenase n=1 Tax=Saccharothrix sp. 6-C TaxID=2781735 RepID=UPI001916F493|nr:TauD/TfdA family dioxygenase [Saccharothrix sp. 6-C]QQQ75755.1 TauD/TfdA family dioxygenase [Saccharothrix sp. 6-C]